MMRPPTVIPMNSPMLPCRESDHPTRIFPFLLAFRSFLFSALVSIALITSTTKVEAHPYPDLEPSDFISQHNATVTRLSEINREILDKLEEIQSSSSLEAYMLISLDLAELFGQLLGFEHQLLYQVYSLLHEHRTGQLGAGRAPLAHPDVDKWIVQINTDEGWLFSQYASSSPQKLYERLLEKLFPSPPPTRMPSVLVANGSPIPWPLPEGLSATFEGEQVGPWVLPSINNIPGHIWILWCALPSIGFLEATSASLVKHFLQHSQQYQYPFSAMLFGIALAVYRTLSEKYIHSFTFEQDYIHKMKSTLLDAWPQRLLKGYRHSLASSERTEGPVVERDASPELLAPATPPDLQSTPTDLTPGESAKANLLSTLSDIHHLAQRIQMLMSPSASCDLALLNSKGSRDGTEEHEN